MFAASPKICFSTSTFQDFCSDLFCSYLQEIFEILQTSVSQKTF